VNDNGGIFKFNRALGVVLFECLSLKHPFDAKHQCALILKIIQAEVCKHDSHIVDYHSIVDVITLILVSTVILGCTSGAVQAHGMALNEGAGGSPHYSRGAKRGEGA
jgi:hypothetical protein